MSATALLKKVMRPNDSQITQAMNGNLCRCGTYTRIHAAIKQASHVITAPQSKKTPVDAKAKEDAKTKGGAK